MALLTFTSRNVFAGEPVVHMLAPGFTVQELPIKISNINNLRFAPDGRLTALGYDGRIHLLRDTNGDGLEDQDEIFWNKPTITVPVGMCWSPEGLYVSSHGKVSLLRDTNGDGKAEEEEVVAQGWPATDVASGGVDATSVTRDKEGNLYFGLLVSDYANAYRIKDGVSHYDINSQRGTIQKWNVKTKKLETIATGIRVPYNLAFNKAGDLFNTDQEGETWMPNGNPLDEFNQIILGRNYGFPPRHEKWLPNLISEPPLVSFGPQHQSSCGFVFNEPEAKSNSSAGQGLFGPKWWEGDALVAGESRGQIWRVKLVKTPSGYVGKETTIARISMLTTDVQISPQGDLYVSCHSGKPDWGTGPKGEGKIFKISYTDKKAPQPVSVWADNSMEVHVAFDRPVHPSITNNPSEIKIEFGEFVSTADRYEAIRPSYQVVKYQDTFPRGKLAVTRARLNADRHTLILDTAPHPQSVTYALTVPNVKSDDAGAPAATIDLTYNLHGVVAGWRSTNVYSSRGWDERVAHIDSSVNAAFSTSQMIKKREAHKTDHEGNLVLMSQLLLPAGTNILRFERDATFSVSVGTQSTQGVKNSSNIFTAKLTVAPEGKPLVFKATLEADALSKELFHVSYSMENDPTIRPVPFSFFLLPWAPEHLPLPPMDSTKKEKELVGGDFERGRSLFFGEKLKCATCHRIRGEGKLIAPDLSNLASRDVASILRDIKDPSATINPDYVAFQVTLKNDDQLTGFVRTQTENSLTILGVDGKETVVARNELKELLPSSLSLMPSGLLDGLKEIEIRDLLVLLNSEPPIRKASELESLRKKITTNQKDLSASPRPLQIVLIANKQDHGPAQHDYPAWQKTWIDWLNQAQAVTATNAWEWPTDPQFEKADVLLFYYWNKNWSAERFAQLERFFARGGGVVLLHAATISATPEDYAKVVGLASQSGRSKYLHTPLNLKMVPTHPLAADLPKQIYFLDEPYWPLIESTNVVSPVATASLDGKDWTQLWTLEKGKGRIFASVLGHYTWTLNDPLYRLMILRGIAWSAGENQERLSHLAWP